MRHLLRHQWIELFLVSVLLSGCATAPKFDSGKSQGTWKTEIQFKDKMKDKSQSFSSVVFAEKNWPLRMEITGTLGVSVASLLIEENQIHGLLHLKKQSLIGENSQSGIKPVIGFEIPPEILLSAFFDEPISDKNWTCRQDANGKVEECLRLKDKFRIAWADRDEERKRVILETDRFEAQILVKDFQPKVQNRDRVFKLNIPSSYKQYKVRP